MDYADGAARWLSGTPVIPALYAATEGPRLVRAPASTRSARRASADRAADRARRRARVRGARTARSGAPRRHGCVRRSARVRGRAVPALSRYHCGLSAERGHSDRAALLHERRRARARGRRGGRSARDRCLAAVRRAQIGRDVSRLQLLITRTPLPMPPKAEKVRKQYANKEYPHVVLRFEDGHEIHIRQGRVEVVRLLRRRADQDPGDLRSDGEGMGEGRHVARRAVRRRDGVIADGSPRPYGTGVSSEFSQRADALSGTMQSASFEVGGLRLELSAAPGAARLVVQRRRCARRLRRRAGRAWRVGGRDCDAARRSSRDRSRRRGRVPRAISDRSRGSGVDRVRGTRVRAGRELPTSGTRRRVRRSLAS